MLGSTGAVWWGLVGAEKDAPLPRAVLPIPQPWAEQHSSPGSPVGFCPFMGYPKLITMPANHHTHTPPLPTPRPQMKTPKAKLQQKQSKRKLKMCLRHLEFTFAICKTSEAPGESKGPSGPSPGACSGEGAWLTLP